LDEGQKGGALAAWLRKMKISKWQAVVLAAGLAGILLLCVTSLTGGSPQAGGKANAVGTENIRVDLTDYEQQLERRLQETIGAIAGAGETRVMLTLDSGSEPIYATQGKTDQKHSESDAGSEESLSADKQYVTIGTGSGQQGLVLKMVEPQVRGVAVVCQGGDDLLVRQSIIEMVTAVLGVGANKVSVARLG
jgi:stage III sporulation protein AG